MWEEKIASVGKRSGGSRERLMVNGMVNDGSRWKQLVIHAALRWSFCEAEKRLSQRRLASAKVIPNFLVHGPCMQPATPGPTKN